MICFCCKKEFYEDFRAHKDGTPRFCSSFCAHKRFLTEDSKAKISNSLYKSYGTMPRYCKICSTKLNYKNKSGYCSRCKPPRITRYQNVKNFRRNRKLELVEYKGGKCSICGYSKIPSILEFHHRNPSEKSFTIGSGKDHHKKTWEEVLKEVDKCELVCPNCHKEIHFNLNSK